MLDYSHLLVFVISRYHDNVDCMSNVLSIVTNEAKYFHGTIIIMCLLYSVVSG